MVVDVEITTLVHGGRGLGRHQGQAVFVPLTAPGDVVRCQVVHNRKQYLEAELIEILHPSTLRRQPPCALFGDCGGCQWQHLPYQQQLAWKQQVFADLLIRRNVADSSALLPIQPAPAEWHYRNRAQFKCRMTHSGFVIGFYRSGSHYVVDVEHCPLVQSEVQSCLRVLRARLPDSPAPDKAPQIDVSCGDDGALQLVVHLLPEAPDSMLSWLCALGASQNWHLSVQSGRKDSLRILHHGSPQFIKVGCPEMGLRISPGGFAQVHSAQNRRLVAAVEELADLHGHETVLDLFCGVGNFSLPLARKAGKLVGVEEYGPAITDARNNAVANGVSAARFVAEPAEGAVARHFSAEAIDLVVVDPPRTGCYQVMKELLLHKPKKVIYVSCDPATLARDLTPMVHHGYNVTSTQAFDMFPQTWHIESVTCLEH